MWGKLDAGLIRDIDLMDNGVMDRHPGHFSALLETFAPTFAETGADEDGAYHQAVAVADQVLARSVAHAFAAAQAMDAVAQAAARAEDPRIVVLESRLPWEEAVFDLGLDRVLYVIRPAGKDWTVSAVPPERASFAQKKPLPAAWGGLRDGELAAICGVAEATFCHSARFVCGARTRDAAVAMARLAADS